MIFEDRVLKEARGRQEKRCLSELVLVQDYTLAVPPIVAPHRQFS